VKQPPAVAWGRVFRSLQAGLTLARSSVLCSQPISICVRIRNSSQKPVRVSSEDLWDGSWWVHFTDERGRIFMMGNTKYINEFRRFSPYDMKPGETLKFTWTSGNKIVFVSDSGEDWRFGLLPGKYKVTAYGGGLASGTCKLEVKPIPTEKLPKQVTAGRCTVRVKDASILRYPPGQTPALRKYYTTLVMVRFVVDEDLPPATEFPALPELFLRDDQGKDHPLETRLYGNPKDKTTYRLTYHTRITKVGEVKDLKFVKPGKTYTPVIRLTFGSGQEAWLRGDALKLKVVAKQPKMLPWQQDARSGTSR